MRIAVPFLMAAGVVVLLCGCKSPEQVAEECYYVTQWKVSDLVDARKYDGAVDEIDSYRTAFPGSPRDKDLLAKKRAYVALQSEANEAADAVKADARRLAANGNLGRALNAIDGFKKEYAGNKAVGRLKAIDAAYMALAGDRLDETRAAARRLAAAKRYPQALARIRDFEVEMAGTDWAAKLKPMRVAYRVMAGE
jgi:hypothetical protein